MGVRLVRVHLSCDHLVDVPIESDLDGHLAYVDPENLGLSDALVQDLRAYQRSWEEQADEDGPVGPWPEKGQSEDLLGRLRAELGPGYLVREV
jgi:hypothetical protein